MKATAGDYRTLGALWTGYGVLRLCAAAAMAVYSGRLALLWGALLDRVPDPVFWMTAFRVALLGAIAWSIVSALLSLLAGFALLRDAASARGTSLAASLAALPDLPFGVMLGVYTIAALGRWAPAAGHVITFSRPSSVFDNLQRSH